MPNEAKDGGAGFTAGPWELIEEPTGNDNFARSIYGPAGDYKALLIARCDQNFSHADGQLIVAAPDLYAALKPFADAFRAATNPGDSDLDDEQPYHITVTLGDLRRARRLVSP